MLNAVKTSRRINAFLLWDMKVSWPLKKTVQSTEDPHCKSASRKPETPRTQITVVAYRCQLWGLLRTTPDRWADYSCKGLEVTQWSSFVLPCRALNWVVQGKNNINSFTVTGAHTVLQFCSIFAKSMWLIPSPRWQPSLTVQRTIPFTS
jgi:hypothetical protein